jgi:hypothetical protein
MRPNSIDSVWMFRTGAFYVPVTATHCGFNLFMATVTGPLPAVIPSIREPSIRPDGRLASWFGKTIFTNLSRRPSRPRRVRRAPVLSGLHVYPPGRDESIVDSLKPVFSSCRDRKALRKSRGTVFHRAESESVGPEGGHPELRTGRLPTTEMTLSTDQVITALAESRRWFPGNPNGRKTPGISAYRLSSSRISAAAWRACATAPVGKLMAPTFA